MTGKERAELKAAISERRRALLQNAPADPGKVELPVPGSPVAATGRSFSVEHGTESAYSAYGCRCAPCRKVASDARRRRRNSRLEEAREYDRNRKRALRGAA